MDEYLDDLQRQFVQVIFESHAAEQIDLQVAVQLAVVARFYERIGDHAVNVGERVRYIVTGWTARAQGAARYAERQAASDLDDMNLAPLGSATVVLGCGRRLPSASPSVPSPRPACAAGRRRDRTGRSAPPTRPSRPTRSARRPASPSELAVGRRPARRSVWS